MNDAPREMRADRDTDRLYAEMRRRYGPADARANGYRSHGWFLREQAMVLAALGDDDGLTVDVACGSGLMLQPLLGHGATVLGLDYNAAACRDALVNDLPVIRGDAFAMPFADGVVKRAVNCQFLNQQDRGAADALLRELARVLAPGGRAVLVWRNGDAMIHRVVHGLCSLWDRWRGRAVFPYVEHPLPALAAQATILGLRVRERAVVLPPLDWRSERIDGLAARLIGASWFLVLEKPRP